jgi:hypothetical protein
MIINMTQIKGLHFINCLGLLFIAFQLSGIITWSWWWVLAPIWIPVGLAMLANGLGFLAGFLNEMVKNK